MYVVGSHIWYGLSMDKMKTRTDSRAVYVVLIALGKCHLAGFTFEMNHRSRTYKNLFNVS